MDREPLGTSDGERNDLAGVMDYLDKQFHSALPALDVVQGVIGQWADETFPRHTGVSHVEHLREQVEQLYEALSTEREGERIADVIILCLSLAYHDGITISTAIEDKHLVNQQRTWVTDRQGSGLAHHSEHFGA